MESRHLRIAIKSIKVRFNGDDPIPENEPPAHDVTKEGSKKANNVIAATLVYPRPGVESVNSIKNLHLPSSGLCIFEPDDFWTAGLFKEDILSESRLVVEVMDRDEVSKIGQFFRAVFSKILGGLLNPVIEGISNIALGSTASEVSNKLAKAVKGDGEEKMIGIATTGKVDFWVKGNQLFFKQHGVTEWKAVPATGEVEFPLKAPQELSLKESASKVSKRNSLKKKNTGKSAAADLQLKKNDNNGVLALQILSFSKP